MGKKVFIRFLQQGLVEAEAPDNFNILSDKEKLEWANGVLKTKTDKELLHAMAEFENPDRNGYFDEAPYACAIEEGEEENAGIEIVSTSLWELFNSPSWNTIVIN